MAVSSSDVDGGGDRDRTAAAGDIFGFGVQSRILSAQARCALVMLVIGAANIALAVVQAELRWQLRALPSVESVCNVVKAANSALVALILVALVAYYRLELEYRVLRRALPVGSTLWNSGLLPRFSLEFAVLAIHAPPWPASAPSRTFANDIRPLIGFQFEAILTSCVFLRVYLLWRWICSRSRLFSPSGRFIEALTNSEFDATLVAKMTIRDHPIPSVGIVFALLVSTTSYTLWCLERWNAVRQSIIDPDGNFFQTNIGHELIWFGNCVWLTLVTVFTIGYGDLYPVTPAGRVTILVSSFVGNMCTCLLIAIMTHLVHLTPIEEKVRSFLARDRYRRQVQKLAAECVQSAYRAWKKKTRARRADFSRSAASARLNSKDEQALRPLAGGGPPAEAEARWRCEGYEKEATSCADAIFSQRQPASASSPAPHDDQELNFKLHLNLKRWRQLKRQGMLLARDEGEERQKQEAEIFGLRRSLDTIVAMLEALEAKVDAIGSGDPAALEAAAAASAAAAARRRPRRPSSTSSLASLRMQGPLEGLSRPPNEAAAPPPAPLNTPAAEVLMRPPRAGSGSGPAAAPADREAPHRARSVGGPGRSLL